MTNYKEDLVALWKLWVPSTFLNFALMPMWARIPWVATTSLLLAFLVRAGWLAVLPVPPQAMP